MRLIPFFLLLTFCLGCNEEPKETTTKGKLHVFIPQSIAPVMLDEINSFLALYRQNGAEISNSIVTSEDAVRHFTQNSAKILFLPRTLTAIEKEQVKKISSTPNELIVAYDGIVAIVNSKNNFDKISTTEIQKILSGSITKWEQFSPAKPAKGVINVFLQDSSDVMNYLIQRFTRQEGIKVNFVRTASDIQTIQSVEANPSSLGFVSLSWIDSAKAKIKVLNIGRSKDDTDTTFTPPADAIGKFYSPDPAYIYLNYYPLKRAIYMYTHTRVDLAMGFGTYVATAEGQKLFLKRGLLPATQKIKLRTQ